MLYKKVFQTYYLFLRMDFSHAFLFADFGAPILPHFLPADLFLFAMFSPPYKKINGGYPKKSYGNVIY